MLKKTMFKKNTFNVGDQVLALHGPSQAMAAATITELLTKHGGGYRVEWDDGDISTEVPCANVRARSRPLSDGL